VGARGAPRRGVPAGDSLIVNDSDLSS
jgi:hypothetical protein